jgi:transposase
VGDSIAKWVAHFNEVGLAAVERQAGGRPPTQYGPAERDRILAEFRRRPDRERDGTATWSLNTLRRAVRRAPDGLPKVSTYTIWVVLHDAGITRQKDRTWCQTGLAIRASASVARSKSRIRTPARKKLDRAGLHRRGAHGVGCLGHGRSRALPGHSSTRRALAAHRSACSVPARRRQVTAKLLTLFHPATGQVRVKGVTRCPNVVLHAWLEAELAAIADSLPPAISVQDDDHRAALGALAGGSDRQAHPV